MNKLYYFVVDKIEYISPHLRCLLTLPTTLYKRLLNVYFISQTEVDQ